MKLHIENSIVIENNGRTTTLGKGEYEFDSASEFIKFVEGLGEQSKQPYIKDERVRKAVRAWAEANEYSLVKAGYDIVSEPNYGNVQIHFEFLNVVDEDNFGVHTIAELCGEEEE